MNTLWRCKKCGTVQGGFNKPMAHPCSKGGTHQWTQHGDSKTTPSVYRCSKCGTVTSSQSKPLDRNCVKGGKCRWSKYRGC